MLRISWAEKKTNVNVLREGNVQRSLLKTIRKRQMEFLGHVCRRRGLEFLSLTGKVEGKRDRGKQRITFLDSLCNSAPGGQSKGLNFLKLSDARDVPDLAPDDDDDESAKPTKLREFSSILSFKTTAFPIYGTNKKGVKALRVFCF